MKKVSFVIPCYRSEHTLPHVIAEIEETMKKLEGMMCLQRFDG